MWSLIFLFSQVRGFVSFYSNGVYPLVQSARCTLFHIIPFSVGDVLYILGGLWLLLTLLRWVYYLRRFGIHKDRLLGSVLNTLNVLLCIYLVFLLAWGGNYYKDPLAKSWGLPTSKKLPKEVRIAKHKQDVKDFARFLAGRLATYATEYTPLTPTYINERALAYYREFTDSKVKENGVWIKPTLFAPLMLRMGVDGYYNPFTGEGQANMRQPLFLMPFIVCHEMAHQAGIAAEGDANLLAYALCTSVSDHTFRYSAYLNLWLYTSHRLYRQDSVLARQLEGALPTITRRHIDTLEEIYRRYHGAVSAYTSDIYDGYLRMQQQEGISSYGNVVREAWALEQARKTGLKKVIRIF
ncbi:DUF3810 domain-containing protein [Nemorincola caseinilytica]|uniref:DUF3810 domain-containing protein n=1 Tax=Nemorincola caseinilytica TaxID=2054315 RepID=A0ABP8N6X6_9BACT